MILKEIILNKERGVRLTAMIQKVGGEFNLFAKRPAVLVIPGGGYQFCSDREAEPVGFCYLKAGFDVFILRYSVGKDAVWPNPLRDYESAMRYIRIHADEWHIDTERIAVVGFSAGGHLAGAAAAISEIKPAAAVLGYPVLRKDTASEWETTAPSIIDAVDEKTCPCFLFGARTDDVVPVQNILDMLNALNAHDVPFECHIYAYGPHGFSTADESLQPRETVMTERIRGWVDDSIGWLREILDIKSIKRAESEQK